MNIKKMVVIALFFVAVGYGVSKSMNNSSVELCGLGLANVEALAQGEGGGGSTGNYECSVTTNCFSVFGKITGSVSCKGQKCERGMDYVKCDGRRTEC